MKKILLLAGAGLLTLSAVTATMLHNNNTKTVKKQHHTVVKEKPVCRPHTCPFSS